VVTYDIEVSYLVVVGRIHLVITVVDRTSLFMKGLTR
jgi:hypothetical protein